MHTSVPHHAHTLRAGACRCTAGTQSDHSTRSTRIHIGATRRPRNQGAITRPRCGVAPNAADASMCAAVAVYKSGRRRACGRRGQRAVWRVEHRRTLAHSVSRIAPTVAGPDAQQCTIILHRPSSVPHQVHSRRCTGAPKGVTTQCGRCTGSSRRTAMHHRTNRGPLCVRRSPARGIAPASRPSPRAPRCGAMSTPNPLDAPIYDGGTDRIAPAPGSVVTPSMRQRRCMDAIDAMLVRPPMAHPRCVTASMRQRRHSCVGHTDTAPHADADDAADDGLPFRGRTRHSAVPQSDTATTPTTRGIAFPFAAAPDTAIGAVDGAHPDAPHHRPHRLYPARRARQSGRASTIGAPAFVCPTVGEWDQRRRL
jgi:hypothetical protein